MSRAQPSILTFFQPRQQPNYAAPPSQTPPAPTPNGAAAAVAQPVNVRPIAPAPAPTGSAAAQPIAGLPIGLPPTVTLHPQASIAPVSEKHISALRRINSLLLSVNYPDSFYHRVLDPSAAGLFSRVILWRDDDSPTPTAEPQVIGGLVCRLEPSPFLPGGGGGGGKPHETTALSSAGPHAIYIQSLALLSPYRAHGLAAAALEDILASAAAYTDSSPASGLDIRTIYAHVWTENDEGMRWYAARGFARHGGAPVGGYYFKLRPDTAWVVRREVGAHSGGPAVSGGDGASAGPVVAQSVTAAAVNLPGLGNDDALPRPPGHSPSPAPSGRSFQNAGPGTEWNDLPEEMVAAASSSARSSRNDLLSPPPGSGASSRSSSTARKKRDRSYPAAAFGS